MEYMTARFELKAADARTVRGHASIFDNTDLENDVVLPGAFQEFVETSEGRVLMLFGHGMQEALPIGKAKVFEDQRGLAFDAELIMDDPFVQRVHCHLKAKTLEQMSIGYDVIDPDGAEYRDGRRLLKRLRLWEISVVPWGMNPLARIEAVKSRADLEHAAREVLGLSKSKARRLAHAGWPVISGDDPEDESEHALTPEALKQITRDIVTLNNLLKPTF